MRILLILTVMVTFSGSSLAEEKLSFAGWMFPDAKKKEQVSTWGTSTSADKKNVQSITSGLGQYVTEKPFHEVLAFYVHKSELEPPNWSILGRKFPGTDVHMPAHFTRIRNHGKEPSVTLLHFIREDVATAQLLVTDHTDVGFISVSITRAKNDELTLIQLIQHPSKLVKLGTEQSDAREISTTSALR